MYSDHAGLELLSAEECLDLLRTRSVGRIGLSASSLPFVVPVRYVVDEDRILMRAGRDTRMAAATNDAVVAFEVDEFDQDLDAGWSVMVQGLAREVTATTLVDPAAEAVLSSWVMSMTRVCSAPLSATSDRGLVFALGRLRPRS